MGYQSQNKALSAARCPAFYTRRQWFLRSVKVVNSEIQYYYHLVNE